VRLKPQIFFDFLVLLFFALLVWEAKDWKIQAWLFPWVIGIPMIVIAGVRLGIDLKGESKETPSGAAPVDFQFAKGIDPEAARWRTVNIFSWISGFLMGVWLAGFSVTIPVFFFLYLKSQSREGWAISVSLTGGAWLLYWGVFVRILHLPLPEGQIFLWMGL